LGGGCTTKGAGKRANAARQPNENAPRARRTVKNLEMGDFTKGFRGKEGWSPTVAEKRLKPGRE
jgi:hypothetical protein